LLVTTKPKADAAKFMVSGINNCCACWH